MLDYRGLAALYAIIETQGFASAAEKLNVSQSAISQRLKGLQTYYGDPLLIRTPEYRPTELGGYLLGHFKRVTLLEQEVEGYLKKKFSKPKISIALSRDSLDTWFMELISTQPLFDDVMIEIVADDQEITLDYLKRGLVSACFSTSEASIPNCYHKFLGYMNYLLVSTPAFRDKYFSNHQDKENLLAAPALLFDKHDRLHHEYLKKFFNINYSADNYHVMPSVRGFREFTLRGQVCALIPEIDIRDELKKGELVVLYPDKVWKMPVYFHYWDFDNPIYKKFYRHLAQLVQEKLQ